MEQPARTGPGQAGLSVVEILATLAVCALLATVAVPNYLGSRATQNESVVVATLRSLSAAQAAFLRAAWIDRDGDGTGEFGTIGEVTGTADLLGKAERVTKPVLTPELGDVDGAGRTSHSGFWFALYLPASDGRGLAEREALRSIVDPELAERHWTCLAWPLRHGANGVSTYFVNETGKVRRNRDGHYSGTVRVPPAGAALVGAKTPDHVVGKHLATNEIGADGGVWLVVE